MDSTLKMKVGDLMTPSPTCCTESMSLVDAARMMVENDCGEIPVVENLDNMRLVGVVTDRDITCRTVALGRNPLALRVADCMSTPVVTVSEDASLEACCQIFEENQVRRAPVVDAGGKCCGIIAQADIAEYAPAQRTAETVREISRPTDCSSRVTTE